MSGQQLQENRVLSAAHILHTRGAGQGSWQPELTPKWPWQPQCQVLDAGILILHKVWDLRVLRFT